MFCNTAAGRTKNNITNGGYIIQFHFFYITSNAVFEKYIHFEDSKKLVNAVIYGSDANAISVANALRTEKPGRFRLKGFIDKFNQNKTSKSILNLLKHG